jgi:hypothetical protein
MERKALKRVLAVIAICAAAAAIAYGLTLVVVGTQVESPDDAAGLQRSLVVLAGVAVLGVLAAVAWFVLHRLSTTDGSRAHRP